MFQVTELLAQSQLAFSLGAIAEENRHFLHALDPAFDQQFKTDLVTDGAKRIGPQQCFAAQGKEPGHRIAHAAGERTAQQRRRGAVEPAQA